MGSPHLQCQVRYSRTLHGGIRLTILPFHRTGPTASTISPRVSGRKPAPQPRPFLDCRAKSPYKSSRVDRGRQSMGLGVMLRIENTSSFFGLCLLGDNLHMRFTEFVN